MRDDEAIPARVGRYRVVGRLAMGGMAEILLCAIDGPSGFSKPVVVKRVLPKWAERADFRSMFVDEARIVAGLRHPNVVPVIELGQDGADLYLAMEYLDGESLDVLVRRLVQGAKRLPPHLAAYVVAEAAAGLHAAHELKDPSGAPLEVVHRDVSPHNLFLGYDGSVRVIDFGIAKARQRETHTETGTVKGKFAYMSPEQIDAQPLDRRSDVFALGVVLWELLAFKRLYQRGTHLEIVKAICFADAPLVETVDASIPGALSRITEKALARDREARYASAAELRRDLIQALRALPGAEDPREELATLMAGTFEERFGEKRDLLKRLASGSHITSVPLAVAEGDRASDSIEIELPDAEQALMPRPSSPPTRADRPGRERAAPPPSRSAMPWAIGLASLAALGVGGWALASSRSDAPTPVAAEPPAPTDAGVDAVSEEVALDAGPQRVHLSVESIPPGASVSIDGEARGTTPLLDLEIEAIEGPRDVTLTLEGYLAATPRVAGDRDASLHVELRRAPRRRTSTETEDVPAEAPPPSGGRGSIFRVD